MSLYLEQIRQLVALQRVDDAIHSVEMELEQAPKELEDLKNRFAATNTQRERVLEKLAHLKEQEKRITGEQDDAGIQLPGISGYGPGNGQYGKGEPFP